MTGGLGNIAAATGAAALGAGGWTIAAIGGAAGGASDYLAWHGFARAGSYVNNGGTVKPLSAVDLGLHTAGGALGGVVLRGAGLGLSSLARKIKPGLFARSSVTAPSRPAKGLEDAAGTIGRNSAKTGFRSFSSLKRSLGPAGPEYQWHHIVEQSKVGQFGAKAIHHADNVVAVPTNIHRRISGFYSSKQDFTGGLTVRKWLDGQTFEFQRKFGMDILRRFGAL